MSDDYLRDSIVPKSDQMNADDLLAGPITVTIAGVGPGDKEQPVSIRLLGRQPYKPCKSMRRVLIAAWGDDGHAWVGRSATLYCDPSVEWGGVRVGGIRISHLTDLAGTLVLPLTKTRGRREPFRVEPLEHPLRAVIGDALSTGRWTKEQIGALLAPATKAADVAPERVAGIVRALVGVPTRQPGEEG